MRPALVLRHVVANLFGYAVVPVHEIGHVVAREVAGEGATAVQIGDGAAKEIRLFGVVWRLGRMPVGTGWQGLTSGPWPEHARLRLIIYAGGPFANLVCGVICGWAFLQCHQGVAFAFFGVAALNMLACIGNLTPKERDGIVSDGLGILLYQRAPGEFVPPHIDQIPPALDPSVRRYHAACCAVKWTTAAIGLVMIVARCTQ